MCNTGIIFKLGFEVKVFLPTACLTCDAAGAGGKQPLTPGQSVLVWLGVKGEMHGYAALDT